MLIILFLSIVLPAPVVPKKEDVDESGAPIAPSFTLQQQKLRDRSFTWDATFEEQLCTKKTGGSASFGITSANAAAGSAPANSSSSHLSPVTTNSTVNSSIPSSIESKQSITSTSTGSSSFQSHPNPQGAPGPSVGSIFSNPGNGQRQTLASPMVHQQGAMNASMMGQNQQGQYSYATNGSSTAGVRGPAGVPGIMLPPQAGKTGSGMISPLVSTPSQSNLCDRFNSKLTTASGSPQQQGQINSQGRTLSTSPLLAPQTAPMLSSYNQQSQNQQGQYLLSKPMGGPMGMPGSAAGARIMMPPNDQMNHMGSKTSPTMNYIPQGQSNQQGQSMNHSHMGSMPSPPLNYIPQGPQGTMNPMGLRPSPPLNYLPQGQVGMSGGNYNNGNRYGNMYTGQGQQVQGPPISSSGTYMSSSGQAPQMNHGHQQQQPHSINGNNNSNPTANPTVVIGLNSGASSSAVSASPGTAGQTQQQGLPGVIVPYTWEERQQRIARYLAKKQRRVWKKSVKYDCRKRLAEGRPRVKGRFVSHKATLSANNSGDEADDDGEENGGGSGEDGSDGEKKSSVSRSGASSSSSSAKKSANGGSNGEQSEKIAKEKASKECRKVEGEPEGGAGAARKPRKEKEPLTKEQKEAKRQARLEKKLEKEREQSDRLEKKAERERERLAAAAAGKTPGTGGAGRKTKAAVGSNSNPESSSSADHPSIIGDNFEDMMIMGMRGDMTADIGFSEDDDDINILFNMEEEDEDDGFEDMVGPFGSLPEAISSGGRHERF